MRCLCCGKKLGQNASEKEVRVSWHTKCIMNFFGSEIMPEIRLDTNALEDHAKSGVDAGVSVTGVQKKISLGFSKTGKNRLTMVDYPAGYILKPQTHEYPYLPEFEYLAMRMAKIAGIKTVPFALIKENDELAYITTRIDRSRPGEETVKFAMEDFCQLAGKMTFDKYKGSYELCARIVKSFSSQKGLDLSEIFIRVVFSYIVGNSDMHLKNFSLIEREPSGRDFMLSPAYDILPVNVILPDDKDETALAVNGKKRNLRRKDFTAFAESCDLNKKTADKIIDKLCSYRDKYIDECNNSLLPDDLIEKETKLIEKRIGRLLL